MSTLVDGGCWESPIRMVPLNNPWQLLLFVGTLGSGSQAQLVMTLHNNTALGMPTLATMEVSSLSGSVAVDPLQSAQFLGRILLPSTPHGLNFSCQTDGIVRLWVDEHLVLDDAQVVPTGAAREIMSWVTFPSNYTPAVQALPVPFRLEYTRIHGSGNTGVLKLLWSVSETEFMKKNSPTAMGVLIPGRAFNPELTLPQQQREALRSRLFEPVVPWQTYAISSMTAHTLCPTGFVVRFTLVDLATRNVLGDVKPFHLFTPAHVLPGRHSLNGSDYTAVTIQSWIRGKTVSNASVKVETTAAVGSGDVPCNGTAGMGGARCDLVVAISCAGSDCKDLAVVAYGDYQWDRIGSLFMSAGPGTLIAQPAGFPPVSLHTVTGELVDLGRLPGIQGDTLGLRMSDNGTVGLSTGEQWSAPAHSAAIARGRVLGDAVPPAVGATNTSSLFLPMRDVLAWNTVYTHALHVYTPVARSWAGNDDSGTTFVWDVFFAAIMLGTDTHNPRSRDIAEANVITTIFSRTVTGMVPNYRNGRLCTYDRTEPMVGGWTLQILDDVFHDQWLVELLLPPLIGWNNWTWDKRLAGGVLGQERAELISLGSDATNPPGLNTPHTLAAARYESGLDNSPMYDGNDSPKNEDQGVGPVRFDPNISRMELYDVGFSVYHGLDAEMLAGLLGDTDPALASELRVRSARVYSSINANLFDPETQQYCNRLYNGSFYCRTSPTAVAPMLAGIASPGRVSRMLELLGSPDTFCVNETASGSGPPGANILWRMSGVGSILPVNASVTCGSNRCLQATVLGVAQFEAVEATVAAAPTQDDPTPLVLYRAPSGLTALVTPSAAAALPPEYASVGTEGWCGLSSASTRRIVPLSLWRHDALGGFRTCGGSAGCTKDAMQAAGFREVNVAMCHVYPAVTAADIPCRIALPSIARNDTAFWDQVYWRGRQWAPQTFLVWAGLRRYTSDPAASNLRQVLVRKAVAQFEQELKLFGQINENMNGVLGSGSDSPRADGYYHWGALNAFVAIADAGAYPSPTLLGKQMG